MFEVIDAGFGPGEAVAHIGFITKKMIATVIGLGLIGGSFALALKDKGLADKVIGVDNNPANAAKALELGLADEVLPLEAAVDASDLVAIAIPVSAIPLLAVKILNRVRHQIVMDMGSTKEELCEVIAQHARRGRFVATHPMWGTEYSGPESAVKGAFAGRSVVICQREMSDPEAVETVEDIYRQLGMPIICMEPEEHDLHAAYVSHISQVTSYALALTVLEKEREDETIFALAGGGFESTAGEKFGRHVDSDPAQKQVQCIGRIARTHPPVAGHAPHDRARRHRRVAGFDPKGQLDPADHSLTGRTRPVLGRFSGLGRGRHGGVRQEGTHGNGGVSCGEHGRTDSVRAASTMIENNKKPNR